MCCVCACTYMRLSKAVAVLGMAVMGVVMLVVAVVVVAVVVVAVRLRPTNASKTEQK